MDRHLRPTAIVGLIALVLAASLGGIASGAATAQVATPSPVATPVSGATITTLMERTISPLPPAPLTVRLLRITLEPEASVPLHTHPGPELDYVESGTLTVDVDGEAQIVRANGEEETAPIDEQGTLETGDYISFPAETGMALSNTSNEPVELLSAVALPVGADIPSTIDYTDEEPSAEDFAGVSFTVLGDGLLEGVPEGDGTITVQQVEIPAGAALPGVGSPTLISRIDGNMSFAVNSGEVQVTRSSDPGLSPAAVLNEEFSLATGDAAFFPQGVAQAARDSETEPLSVFRMILTPATTSGGEPAVITFLPADQIDAAATPGASPEVDDGDTTDDGTGADEPAQEIAEGATVETTEENVRIRQEPTTASDIIRAVPAGTQLVVTGEPEEGDDLVWFPVETVDTDDPISGWIAQDFIQVVEGDAAEATPDA